MIKENIRRVFAGAGFQLYRSENILYVPEDVMMKAYLMKAACCIKDSVRTVFDVGANVGTFSGFASSLFPEADIYSFEPVADTYKTLNENSKHKNKLYPFNIAFGSGREENKKIFRKKDSQWNSLANNDSWYQDENNFELIQVDTIDHFMSENKIAALEILKTDTEGYDLQVLKGAEKALTENRIKIIVCEVAFNKEDIQHSYFNEIQDYLFPKGFRVFGFTGLQAAYKFQNKMGIGYCNCLFLNSDN